MSRHIHLRPPGGIAGERGAAEAARTRAFHGFAAPVIMDVGVARDRAVAPQSAQASCAAGLTVVNPGEGFGAACAAIRVLRMARA